MIYSNEVWIKCRWRIDHIQKGELCYEVYPELAEIFKPFIANYNESDNQISIDLLIRYVVLVYHRYSPYAINEQNIIKRKIDVCELIGLNIEDKEVEKVIANRNKFVNVAVIHFLKQESSIDWFELNQYLESYYQIMSALTDDSDDIGTKTIQDIAKIKLGIVKEMKQIKSEIEQLTAKVFREDSDMLNYVERYKKAEEENFVVLSPEDFVKSKRVNET